jgi:aromatic-L-amino-acid decarboxylase
LDVEHLERAVEEDRSVGKRPFCVVATVGTTSTTSIDPVPQIAGLCERHGLWLHVDAAYGGVAAILPEMRWVLDGVDRADSMVVNPHKWLFTPVDCSVFFSRRLDVVEQAFSLIPDYLQTSEGNRVQDFMNYGPQLGRRFRSLKLWFVLRWFGRDGIIERLRHHIQLARLFTSWIEADPDWEILAPVPFSTVCFRAHPSGVSDNDLDTLNISIEERLNRSGIAFLSHTTVNGCVALRLAVGNLRTDESDLRETWAALQGAKDVSLSRYGRFS